MRRTGLVLLVSLLWVCVSASGQEGASAPQPDAKLERGKAILIATPKNGRFEKKEYRDSGSKTANIIRTAFAPFSSNAAVSTTCADLACMQAEGKQAFAYYVVPEILHWEDRNTEWSGKPDVVEVNLVVYEGSTQREVSSMLISESASWAIFGGMHPEHLLPDPVKRYVESLY